MVGCRSARSYLFGIAAMHRKRSLKRFALNNKASDDFGSNSRSLLGGASDASLLDSALYQFAFGICSLHKPLCGLSSSNLYSMRRVSMLMQNRSSVAEHVCHWEAVFFAADFFAARGSVLVKLLVAVRY
jgi:hypothetical protein